MSESAQLLHFYGLLYSNKAGAAATAAGAAATAAAVSSMAQAKCIYHAWRPTKAWSYAAFATRRAGYRAINSWLPVKDTTINSNIKNSTNSSSNRCGLWVQRGSRK